MGHCLEPSAEAREQAAAIVNHAGAGDKVWLRDTIARALAEKDAALVEARRATVAWAAKHYGCDAIGPGCPGRCIARCEDLPNLRVRLAKRNERIAALEAALAVMESQVEHQEAEHALTLDVIQHGLAEAERTLRDMSMTILARTTEIVSLEGDLAAMRARAEFAQHLFSCDTLRSDRPPGPCDCGLAALASSPGAINNVVACVNCKRPVEVTTLNAIRCDQCSPGAAWLATAREVVEALGRAHEHDHEHESCLGCALLARPEVQRRAGR